MSHARINALSLALVVSIGSALATVPLAAAQDWNPQDRDTADPHQEGGGGLDEVPPPPFGTAPLSGGVPIDPGWSSAATWIGVGAALGVLTTGILAITTASPDDQLGTGFGVASMSLLAASGPVVALGASSARGHPYVPGSPGLRIGGWTLYGLSLAGGVSLLATGIDGDDPARATFIAPVIGGTLALVLFAIDAMISAIQTVIVSGG